MEQERRGRPPFRLSGLIIQKQNAAQIVQRGHRSQVSSPNGVQATLPKHTDATIVFAIAQAARKPRSFQVRHSWRNQMLKCGKGGGGGRFRSSEREKECDLRITLREGLRVDSRKIEGGGPLGGEDRKQEADKRHRGAYPAAHGEQICAREEQCSAQGDGLGFWTYTAFLTPPIEYKQRKA